MIESPCTKVCVMNRSTGLCIGCKRTLDEIARWGTMLPEERSRIMRELEKRTT